MTFFVVESFQAGKKEAHEPHWSHKKNFQAVNKHEQAMIIQIAELKSLSSTLEKGVAYHLNKFESLIFIRNRSFP